MLGPRRPLEVTVPAAQRRTLLLSARALLLSRTSAIGVLAALAVPGAAHAQAVNLGGANNILLDGRTATHIRVTGNRTAITTNTISNGTAFNSFSNFEEGVGQQVDLYVPNQAGNLVNIVRNGPVVVNGVLNSYKSGRIGGNVFFSDSHGFIVGQSGTINVGALTVNTPTSKFLDGVIGADGKVNDAAAGQLMSGNVPLSDDGVISISGTINARNGITLQGQSVAIYGKDGAPVTGKDLSQRQKFAATVGTNGLVEGGALVVRNGSISIVAAGNVHIAGRVIANATRPGAGGHITVRSGGNTSLASTAYFSANGAGPTGNGGSVSVVAANTVSVADGATFNARGAGSGTGGFVEISGKTAQIGSINLDLDSDAGQDGELLLDPDNLIIGTTGSAADTSYAANISTSGTNIVESADKSIEVVGGGSIISGGGNISLTAPVITLDDGSVINAGTGKVTLTATQTAGGHATITIDDATVTGGDIDLEASSTITSGLLLVTVPDAEAAIALNNSHITATGTLTANATASSEGDLDNLPLGVVVNTVAATIDVTGTAVIQAASAAFTSSATGISDAETQSLLPGGSAVDGAAAITTVNSTSRAHIGGSAQVTTTGADGLSLTANNNVTVKAIATPTATQFGASIAVGVIDAQTSATVDGSAVIDTSAGGGALTLAASTATSAIVTAQSAIANADDGSSASDGEASNPDLAKYKPYESTSEGSISVAGALAISDLTSTTLAKISSTVAANVGGAASLTGLTSNSAAVTATGTAASGTSGVGVAVGINLAKVKNDATLADSITAGSLSLDAGMIGPSGANTFTTAATSGAGAESAKVGVAGSLAVNLVDTESEATLTSGTVTTAGAVSLTSDDVSTSSATATPSAPASGNIGVGASIALNIVANRSLAEIGNGVVLQGVSAGRIGDLTLSATAVDEIDTTAEAGAAGGIAVTPALALSLVNDSTTADLGTLPGTQDGGGIVSLSATQQATETTSSTGQAKGSKVAVGAALALALVNDKVNATTARSIDATGAVSFTAMGASLNTLSATASAAGGKPADNNGDAPSGPSSDVNGMVNSEFDSGASEQSEAGVGDSKQEGDTDSANSDKSARSASSGGTSVSVAAAVSVNVQTATVTASVPDAVTITTPAALTIETVNNTDGSAAANGSAVGTDASDTSAIGVGAAVVVNLVHASNDATLGDATDSVGALDIEALKTDIADPTKGARSDNYVITATSGAGASNVGIAGSLALNLIDTESLATIATGATVAVTGSGPHSGFVTLATDDETTISATAAANVTGGKVGIGGSVALNIIGNRSIAEVDNDASIDGVVDLSLSANAVHVISTEADAGAAGGIAITPALALSLIDNTATAQLDGPGTATQVATGDVTIAAAQQATESTIASGSAAGSTAALGAALSLALINDDVSATTLRSIDATGDVTFTAYGASLGTLSSIASASGAEQADSSGDAKSGQPSGVDSQVDDQFGKAQDQQQTAGVGDSDQQGETTTAADGDHSASTSEGKVTVAAAVAVNVQKSSVLAAVPDAIDITAGGTLTVQSANNTDGSATANGTAVGAAKLGIAAAVAVDVIHTTNDATLGNGTYQVGALAVDASKLDVEKLVAADPLDLAAARADTYLTSATAGAGASEIGIAGALALNLIDTESLATVAGGATVTVSGGNVALSADDETSMTASALPFAPDSTDPDTPASGGKVGIGASVALNIIANRSIAEVGADALITGADSLTLSANAVHDISTVARAGAAGGVAITPAGALSLVNNTTTADLQALTRNGGVQDATGDITITAVQQATESTIASGKAAGSKAAIGAALALALINDDTTATTYRSIDTTGGAETFTAMGASLGTLDSTASAAGAAADDGSGGSSDGSGTVDDKVNGELATGSEKQSDAKVGDSAQTQEVDQHLRSVRSDRREVALCDNKRLQGFGRGGDRRQRAEFQRRRSRAGQHRHYRRAHANG